MNREDFLTILAFLLMLEGYLAENAFPAVLGLLLLLYLVRVKRRIAFSIEGTLTLPSTKLEEGKWCPVEIHLRNPGNDAIVKPCLEGGFDVEELEKFFIPAGGERRVDFRIRPTHKGRFSVGPVKLFVEDPRGLYMAEFLAKGVFDVSVYPSVEGIKEATRIDYNLRLAEMYKRGRRAGTDSLDIRELREYQHGDDFKRIDWKASLRLGELIVREFMKEEDADVYILLDNTKEMRKGLKMAKIDYASTLVLQLASNLEALSCWVNNL